ncbi:MAG TPA: transcriptional repressor LexA [Miltoncostaeaceae bacterium]|nr:transcriptional repressor LexA [Miltoncostaeaceae bacterium]
MGDLSERQAQILDFIAEHSRRNGYPPTVREIGVAVGLASPSTVHAHLAKLESAGHVRRDPSKPRALLVCEAQETEEPITTIDDGVRSIERPDALPLVGQVAAGMPRLAEQDVEDWVTSPFPGDFVLRVVGDSMINAGIFEGDLVVVRSSPVARDREIVVAQIEDEATVKRFRSRDGRVWLQPENDAYPEIESEQLVILGIVVGVLRAL